jgi:hypothetical protein
MVSGKPKPWDLDLIGSHVAEFRSQKNCNTLKSLGFLIRKKGVDKTNYVSLLTFWGEIN